MVWLASVFLIRFSYWYRQWETVFNIFGLLTIAILQFVLPGSNVGITIFAAVAILLVVLYAVGYAFYQHQQWRGNTKSLLLPYNWYYLCVAFLVLSLSIMLFVTQMYWIAAYWATHSLWHMLGGLGWGILLYARHTRQQEWAEDLQLPESYPKPVFHSIFFVPSTGGGYNFHAE